MSLLVAVFHSASKFNSDISKWDTSTIFTMMWMLLNSGFKRTLCGGAWESLTGNNPQSGISLNAFDKLGTSTARRGCCPIGSYMINPTANPFKAGVHCTPCATGRFTDDPLKDGGVDDTSCKYCPKGYQIVGTDTKQCHICPYSKVSLLSLYICNRVWFVYSLFVGPSG